ncbi:N,N'-diacetyllegionaminic acid synthase [bacterium BMS3Bbin08]|nr:N,N'-diacetyllegionaminic acid synthase [bacterium BMS3Bbin08]
MKTFIIAEAGVNHNGSIEIAKKLIDAAVDARADAVKFQTFKTELLISSHAKKSEYQKKSTPKKESLYVMLKRLELSFEQHKGLNAYAKEKGIIFLSTPFDNESVDLLNKLRIPLFKISSGDITNLPFLKYIAKKNKPIILSTGRSTIKEVREAVNTISRAGNGQITLLHCVSNYPASYKDLNLRAIQTLKKSFKIPVGFSDHSLGIEASIAAVAMGASVIEKHITLDRNMKGPDHKASLEPHELKALVSAVRNVESAIGHGLKEPAKSELKDIKKVRKGLFSRVYIPKGSKLKQEMLVIKRPAAGVEPKHLNKIIGRTVLRNIKEDSPIKWEMIGGSK